MDKIWLAMIIAGEKIRQGALEMWDIVKFRLPRVGLFGHRF